MKIVEIHSELEFEQMQSEWDALLRSSASKTTFITWEWMISWWRAYGTVGELCILAVYDQNSILRGLAPLRIRRAKRSGQTVSALCFIGDGSFDSDYLDFIVAEGYEVPVFKSFHAYWTQELRRGTILLLN